MFPSCSSGYLIGLSNTRIANNYHHEHLIDDNNCAYKSLCLCYWFYLLLSRAAKISGYVKVATFGA